MKIHVILSIGFALVVIGCAEKESAAPDQRDDTEMAAESAAVDLPAAEKTGMGSEAFIRHMHDHASHLEGLNAALAAGDLEAARTPADWLLRHEGVTGHPETWQPHIDNLRNAARAVAEAPDIAAASAGAQRIAEACRGCHAAAGINIDISGLKLD
jgi:mono/diheme cytochrome c family protein